MERDNIQISICFYLRFYVPFSAFPTEKTGVKTRHRVFFFLQQLLPAFTERYHEKYQK